MPRNKEETEGLSLLGNKKTVYKDTYAPEVLETFVNKHQGNDYMVRSIVPNLRRFAQSQVSRILQKSPSTIFQT